MADLQIILQKKAGSNLMCFPPSLYVTIMCLVLEEILNGLVGNHLLVE